MDKLADQLTNYIIGRGVIQDDDYAIYKYGFQTGIELTLCVVTCMVLSTYMNMFLECILFMVLFFLQRGYVEGIHMKHFYSCFLVSCGVVIGGLVFSRVEVFSNRTMLFLTWLCLLGVFILARLPVHTTQLEVEQVYYSKKRRKILLGMVAVVFLFYLFDYTVGVRLITYTESIILLSTVLKIIFNRNS